jgi:hypothetical protein
MSANVAKTLEVISCIRDASLEAVAVYKLMPVSFMNLAQFIMIGTKVATDIKTIAADAASVFPELTSLDGPTVAQITGSLYQAVLDVVAALKV